MITRWRKNNKALEANDSPENTTFSRISKPYNAPLTSSPQQQSKLPTWKSPKPGSINCIPRMNGVNPNAVGCTTFLMVSIYKIHLSLTRLKIVSIFLLYCIAHSCSSFTFHPIQLCREVNIIQEKTRIGCT